MTVIKEAAKNGKKAGKAKLLGNEDKVRQIIEHQSKLVSVQPEDNRKICVDTFNTEYLRASGHIFTDRGWSNQ